MASVDAFEVRYSLPVVWEPSEVAAAQIAASARNRHLMPCLSLNLGEVLARKRIAAREGCWHLAFMKLLGRIFGRRGPDYTVYFQGMKEYADEAERTYRGFISVYNEEIGLDVGSAPIGTPPAAISPRGVYWVRLFGAAFMVAAFAKSGGSKKETIDLINIATALGFNSSQKDGLPAISREEAMQLVDGVFVSMINAVSDAFHAGPFLPGVLSPEHAALCEWLHKCLGESMGADNYTSAVRARFSHLVEGNVSVSLAHALRWVR